MKNGSADPNAISRTQLGQTPYFKYGVRRSTAFDLGLTKAIYSVIRLVMQLHMYSLAVWLSERFMLLCIMYTYKFFFSGLIAISLIAHIPLRSYLYFRSPYTPNSKKVALGIGNWALGSYCLAVTQAKLFFVQSYAQMPKAQFPMTNYQSNFY